MSATVHIPSSGPAQHRRLAPAPARAFTLVELLIVIVVVSLLLGLLLPALRGATASSRSFKCQMGLRSIAFEFNIFADDTLNGGRGIDSAELPPGKFRLETFQNAQYGLQEFWAFGSQQTVTFPNAAGRDPLRCPDVRGDIVLRRDAPCSQGGISPWESVSFGFNVRLQWSEAQALAGRSAEVMLTSRILSGAGASTSVNPASLPLVWDIDGASAARAGTTPVYSGPSLGSQALFTDDAYWHPALRHSSRMNVAFIDGHVSSTSAPLRESWAWDFDPGK
jgi:prepilin-type processing-associated H-X9-DG protein/prepilin-type N-terminal cleavage/methylation domain-containing protein